MRNRRKTLLRDHSVLEVTLKACPKHALSQLYLRPSPFKDLKDLTEQIFSTFQNNTVIREICVVFYHVRNKHGFPANFSSNTTISLKMPGKCVMVMKEIKKIQKKIDDLEWKIRNYVVYENDLPDIR